MLVSTTCEASGIFIARERKLWQSFKLSRQACETDDIKFMSSAWQTPISSCCVPQACAISIYTSLKNRFSCGSAARCAATAVPFRAVSSVVFAAAPPYLRRSFTEFEGNSSGEAQPSPHIRRHSREKQAFQTCLDTNGLRRWLQI